MSFIEKAFIMPHPPIIVPEIGRGAESEAAATIEGCRRVATEIASDNPDTIVIITPHGPVFRDAICLSAESTLKGNFGNFGHSSLKYSFENDLDFCNEIGRQLKDEGIHPVMNDSLSRRSYGLSPDLDHGALVPLHFVSKKHSGFRLVHMTFGMLGPAELYRCGMAINRAAGILGRHCAVIASGDLSHKLKPGAPAGYDPRAHEYDEFVVKCIADCDFSGFLAAAHKLRECAGECGHRSISIMLGVFEGRVCDAEVFSYEGPFGVGYMNAMITSDGPGASVLEEFTGGEDIRRRRARDSESPYVRLARRTIEDHVRFGKKPDVYPPSEERKGTFVSIKKNGMLRGCIGTIGPTCKSIEEEITGNAIKAAAEDPRFPPIEAHELDDLVISVDVLSEPEKINTKDQLDVKKYGVIVSKGFRRGLLLPNLDGVDTVDEQVRIALGKADIDESENYDMERFEVVRHT